MIACSARSPLQSIGMKGQANENDSEVAKAGTIVSETRSTVNSFYLEQTFICTV
jgi:hypothetical protein